MTALLLQQVELQAIIIKQSDANHTASGIKTIVLKYSEKP